MVGLIAEQHFVPIFTHILEECPKYMASRDELNYAAEVHSKHGSLKQTDPALRHGAGGKWFGKRFNKNFRNEDASFSEVQELIENSKILNLSWRNDKVFTICLADGKIINVEVVNIFSGEYSCTVDRFYPFNEAVSDMAYNDQVVIYLVSDGRIYFIWKEQVSPESDFVEPEYKSMTCNNLLPNKMSKRCEKRLTLDNKTNTFAIWWSTSKDDVLPWLPNPEQRANIFVYSLETKEPVLLWHLKTDNHLLRIHLLSEATRIVILDESADSEGNIILSEVIHNWKIWSKENETILPLQSELTSYDYDQTITKLAITCCDSSVHIYCQEKRLPKTTKTSFIPSSVRWHPDSYLLLVTGNAGQYQLFDIALNPIVILESNINMLSITHELALSSPIQKCCWMPSSNQSKDSCLLIRFQTGPTCILRFAADSMRLLELVKFYLREDCISEAINVLKNVQWMSEESLQAMYAIFGHLIKQNHTDQSECLLEQLLAVYFVPTTTGDDDNRRKQDLRSMRILARRFFMWLIRAGKYQRAMQIGTSLNDLGLFYKLHQVARQNGETTVAFEAMQKLQDGNQETISSTDSDSDSSESWTTSDSESYPSCQSSEIEIEKSPEEVPLPPKNLPKTKIPGNQSNGQKSSSREFGEGASGSTISVINFGQI